MFITFQPLYTPAFFRWLSNLALYFAHRGRLLVPRAMLNGCQLSPVNFLTESSPLPSAGIELTLFLGISLDLTNAFIHCGHVSLGTSVYEFLGIISLISSATIFTCAQIAILLLSLQYFFFFFYQSSYCNFVIIAFLWHSLLLL